METKQRFSLRKLSIGLTSVLVGISLFGVNSKTVKADTMDGQIKESPKENVNNEKNVDMQSAILKDTDKQHNNAESMQNASKDDLSKTSVAAPNTNKIAGAADVKLDGINAESAENKIVKQNADSSAMNAMDADADKTAQVPQADGAEKSSAESADSKTSADKAEGGESSTQTLGADRLKKNMIKLVSLSESKFVKQDTNTNGGFDEATWGKLDINDWDTNVSDQYITITGYHGTDKTHLLIPNGADFTAAGKNPKNLQVAVTKNDFSNIRGKIDYQNFKSIAFSKTDNQKVKWNDTSMENAFDIVQLHNFDGESLDTSSVTNMKSVFQACNFLTSDDLKSIANWNTSHVTTMAQMFEDCLALTYLPKLNWDVTSVKTMYYMFTDDDELSDLSGISDWDVSHVETFSSMFQRNKAPKLVDLSPLKNWNFASMKQMDHMFYADNISYADFSKWNLPPSTSYQNTQEFIDSASNRLADSNMVIYLGNTMFGTPYDMRDGYESVFSYGDSNLDSPTEMNFSADRILSDFKSDYYLTGAVPSHLAPKDEYGSPKYGTYGSVFAKIFLTNNDDLIKESLTNTGRGPAYNFAVFTDENGKAINYQKTAMFQKAALNLTRDQQFAIVNNLVNNMLEQERQSLAKDHPNEEIHFTYQGTYDDPNPVQKLMGVYKVTYTNKTLPELDTNDKYALDAKNGLDEHANVNDNGGYNESTWGKIDVSKFTTVLDGDNLEITDYTGDTTKPIIIPDIADFWLAGKDQGAKHVEITKANLQKLTNASTHVGLSKSNNDKIIAKDTDWSGLVNKNSKVNKLDLHNLDTSRVTNMSNMFNEGMLTTAGDLSEWNTSSVTTTDHMFNSANISDTGNLDNWDMSKNTNMNSMFASPNLTNIGNISNWDTSSSTDMGHMFSGAVGFKSLDLSKWTTDKVTDMTWMFHGATNLTSVGNLSNWHTGNVVSMDGMFKNVPSLKELNMSNWDLRKVGSTNNLGQYAFYNFINSDPNLVVIANNVQLPTWYNDIKNGRDFFNDHMAVITNNEDLLKTDGAYDTVTIKGLNSSQQVKRSIFYSSTGSNNAVDVLNIVNNNYINQYEKNNAGYTLMLDSSINQDDPISLANAKFNIKSTVTQEIVYVGYSQSQNNGGNTDGPNYNHLTHMEFPFEGQRNIVNLKLDDNGNLVIDSESGPCLFNTTVTKNGTTTKNGHTYDVYTLALTDPSTGKIISMRPWDTKNTISDWELIAIDKYDRTDGHGNLDNSLYGLDAIATVPVYVEDVNGIKSIAPNKSSLGDSDLIDLDYAEFPNSSVTASMSYSGIVHIIDEDTGKSIINYGDVNVTGQFSIDHEGYASGPNYFVPGNPIDPTLIGLTSDRSGFSLDVDKIPQIENYVFDKSDMPLNSNKTAYNLFSTLSDQNAGDANHVFTGTLYYKHKMQDVSGTDPNAKQTNTYKVIENLPDGIQKKIAELDITSHRSATKDMVTGNVTYGNWDANKAEVSTGAGDDRIIAAIDAVPGYTYVNIPRFESIEKDNNGNYVIGFWIDENNNANIDFIYGDHTTSGITYKSMPTSKTFYINYTPNKQTVNYIFYDDTSNKQLDDTKTSYTGVTDCSTNVSLTLPTNYVLSDGQTLPTSYMFKASNPDVLIHVKHATRVSKDLDHADPATRRIVVYMPDNSTFTYLQTLNYVRDVILDLVTNTTTYGTKYNFDANTSSVALDAPDNLKAQYASSLPAKAYMQTSSGNVYLDKDGYAYFSSIKLPKLPGYKAHLIKDPVNPTAFLVSFMAVPEQLQNNPSTSNNDQSSQKEAQAKQKQPEPIQTQPVEDKQTDQNINHISYALMHDTSGNVDDSELVQNDPASLKALYNSTQNSDAAKPQKVNTAKLKKYIVKKHVVKKHKRHVKKYHLRKRSRKYSKKRVIKHRKRASRKFRRFHLKRVK